MTVNQSARNVRLLIGGTDFTPCLISFQGSDSHLDQSGLITFTGQILLGKALGFTQSLDDRKNPGTFCRGKSVTLDIADTAGNLRRHPRGTLRILTPKYDTERQQLTLEVADLITLLNFKEPTDPDKADNKPNGSQSASSVITKLLHETGIESVSGTLPDRLYNYPLNLSGSYLQSVGKLLYANNLVGWIDNQERFRISNVNIQARQSLVGLVVGSNEIWYRRLGGAESPCEKVRAVGTRMVTREIELNSIVTTEQYGSPVVIDPDTSGLIILNQTVETQSWDEDEGIFTIRSEIAKPWGLIVPRVFWDKVDSPPLFQLFLGEVTIEESFFESVEAGGKLKQKVTIYNTDKSGYLTEIEDARPDFIVGNFLGLVNTKQVTETFTYDPKEVLLNKVTQTQEIAVIVLNGSDENWDDWQTIPEYLTISEYKYEEWKQIDKYTWEYSNYVLKPLVKTEGGTDIEYSDDVNERVKQKLALTYDSNEKRRSNSGQETPPAAERRPTDKRIEENPIEYTAYFADPCSGNFKQRDRTYNVEFLAGITIPHAEFFISSDSGANLQLEAIAKREGRLLRSRWQGQEMAGAIANTLLNGYEPLFGVHVTELDGTGQNYLADGCSWVVTAQKAIWSCDGIWVGGSIAAIPVTGNVVIGGVEIPTDGNVVDPGAVNLPYTEIENLSGGMALGGKVISYAYLLSIATGDIQGGMGFGGIAIGSSPIVMSGGMGLGGIATSGSVSTLYWEDFTWDNADWDNLAPSPGWEAINWDAINWDEIF
ncbi:Tip attachment protein J domain-containing protein [Nostoc sp. DSM 114161]|uniref:hypothetical protein n=1 Tax=Nostoc sp. DSM 114161 TaxID=3440143 RepID=UPI0040453161